MTMPGRGPAGGPGAGYMLPIEYFHGDNGAAIGAAHQTGRTALIADVIRRRGEVQTVGDILRRPKAQP